MRHLKQLRKTGDTIVEVLICMAIVGFSVSVSYSISRTSLRKVRDAEERSQSTQLAQQQIEHLKQFLKLHPEIHTYQTYPPTPSQAPWIGELAHNGSSIPDTNITYGQIVYKNLTPNNPVGGLCIYKDMQHLHYTFYVDSACAVNEKGEYYCDSPGHNPTYCGDDSCPVGEGTSQYPVEAGSVCTAHNNAVDQADYPYRATTATVPQELFYITSQTGGQDANTRNDEFYAFAGRFQIGGDGLNTKHFSIVAIQYRIHQ